jgi:prepilin-type N-terminal cleavage/methylation domain-containing protein
MLRPVRPLRGFTLQELVVTVLVIAVLGTVAGSVMSRTRDGMSAEQAKVTLRGAAADQESYFRRFGRFATTTPALATFDTAHRMIPGGAAGNFVGVTAHTVPGPDGSGGVSFVGLAVLTGSGECLTLKIAQPGVSRAEARTRFVPAEAGLPCSGAIALAQDGQQW